jgi:OmpA-OmpF porin, OOP family
LWGINPNYLSMKKFFNLIIAGFLLVSVAQAQDSKSIGFSFFLNDFASAQRIRTTSLNTVINDKTFARMAEMNSGFAVNYYKQMRERMSFSAMLGVSGIRYPMPGRSITKNGSLMEFSATLNAMMTTDEYHVQPYLIMGVGMHKFGVHYGAFMPAGLGLKLNILGDASVVVTSTYRVPVTTETANYHFQHSIGIAAPLGKKN